MHLWRGSLDCGRASLETYRSSLSEDERRRAARFQFAEDRARFVTGRGMLRSVLGRYLDVQPATVSLVYGKHGKPALGAPHADADLQFNLSHSAAHLIIALATGRRVGVDIEIVRPLAAAEQIAVRHFTPEEYRAVAEAPGERRAEQFLTIWTKKEALLKARGLGISGLAMGDSDPGSVDVHRTDREMEGWCSQSIGVPQTYVGTLVVEGNVLEIMAFEFAELDGSISLLDWDTDLHR